MDRSDPPSLIDAETTNPTIKGARKGIAVTFIGLNYEPEPLGIAPYSTGLCNELARRGWGILGSAELGDPRLELGEVIFGLCHSRQL